MTEKFHQIGLVLRVSVFLIPLLFGGRLFSDDLIPDEQFSVQPGDSAIYQKAFQALVSGNYVLAEQLYFKSVEVLPNYPGIWYNYACALAVNGKTDQALYALGGSVQLGYWDSASAASDSDLINLWNDQEFINITSQMMEEERASRRRNSNIHSFYLKQEMLSSYGVILPPDYEEEKNYPLILLLHGRGQICTGIGQLPEMLDLDNVIYILPDAPYSVPANQGGGYQYWPENINEDEESIKSCLNMIGSWHRDLIEDVNKHYFVDFKKIIVIGFSQGGMATYATVLSKPDLFCGAAVIGGALNSRFINDHWWFNSGNDEVKFFIIHGQQNNPEIAFTAKNFLVDHGFDTELHIYPAGHLINQEMADDLKLWIIDLLEI